ncbi:unnamed protein product, partial [Didymodactylos carnosus]
PMDELIKSIKNDESDKTDYHLPTTESELLRLMGLSELQLQTNIKSLLLQTIHMAFFYNTNPFSIVYNVSQLITTLKQLVLSPSHMTTQ